jgi:hypothetical protein
MNKRLGERGQVLPLVAICIAVLMGFAAMTVDIGYLEYQQRQQQNAADGAAIGGAQQLVYSGCTDTGAATTAAKDDAASNGFADGGNGGAITVLPNNPPKVGPYAGNNCAVMVQITNTNTQTFFMKLFGFNQMAETTQAVAVAVSSSDNCAFQLEPNGTPTFHGVKITAPNCALVMNGSPTFDGGNVDFANIGYAGSLTTHGTKFDGGSPEPMLPVADPCPEVAGCKDIAENPPSTSGCTMTITGSTIQPGCYSSFSANGIGTLTMAPGLYILTNSKGNSLKGGTLIGSGVTIYVAPGAAGLDTSGIKADLSACTTSCGGSPQAIPNVLYYQGPSNTNPVNISGPASSFSGLIYAPAANVTYNGNAGSGYTMLVFGDWLLNGTGQGMTFASPPQDGSFIKQAVLSE